MARKQQLPSLSVVVPFRDCEQDVLGIIDEIHQVITSRVPDAEILAIDGGSHDHTWAVLRELRNNFDELKIFRLQHAGTCGECSLRGFREVRGRFILHREPFCNLSLEVFWEMARLSQEIGRGGVFACRPSILNLREKAFDRVLQVQLQKDWQQDVPDPAFPLQFFSKEGLDRIHVMLPEKSDAPGLLIYLLLGFFRQKTALLTPASRYLQADRKILLPEAFNRVSTFRRTLRQLKKLREDLSEIQDLMDI
ncbi:MAG: glycosyltransferase family 2 protein [Acidobacteria bacterium]|nr:glycosyltransferase family 2 protein [Acidobacteriota bacterium]